MWYLVVGTEGKGVAWKDFSEWLVDFKDRIKW